MILYDLNEFFDVKRICFSSYQMCAKEHLNSKTKNIKRNGILLKVNFKETEVGYCNLSVFEELGDLPLSKEIELIKNKKLTNLSFKSFFFSKIDSLYRSSNKNAFTNLILPKNHATVINLLSFSESQLTDLKNSGFDCIKFKMTNDIKIYSKRIKWILKQLSNLGIRVRFDFNSCLNIKSYFDFLDMIDEFHHFVDFIEDPFDINNESLSKINCKYEKFNLAIDRKSINFLQNSNKNYSGFYVFKPACDLLHLRNIDDLLGKLNKAIFTSYMDHPLGQVSALYEAAKIYKKYPWLIENCGFLTHNLFEKTSYSEVLNIKNSVLLPPSEGTGFGFDELLINEKWRNIDEY